MLQLFHFQTQYGSAVYFQVSNQISSEQRFCDFAEVPDNCRYASSNPAADYSDLGFPRFPSVSPEEWRDDILRRPWQLLSPSFPPQNRSEPKIPKRHESIQLNVVRTGTQHFVVIYWIHKLTIAATVAVYMVRDPI